MVTFEVTVTNQTTAQGRRGCRLWGGGRNSLSSVACRCVLTSTHPGSGTSPRVRAREGLCQTRLHLPDAPAQPGSLASSGTGGVGLPSCSAGPKGPHVTHHAADVRSRGSEAPRLSPQLRPRGLPRCPSRCFLVPEPSPPGRQSPPAQAAALTHRAGAGSVRTAEVSPQHGPWRTNIATMSRQDAPPERALGTAWVESQSLP